MTLLKMSFILNGENEENLGLNTSLLLFCFSFFLAANWIKSHFGYYGIPWGDYCLWRWSKVKNQNCGMSRFGKISTVPVVTYDCIETLKII